MFIFVFLLLVAPFNDDVTSINEQFYFYMAIFNAAILVCSLTAAEKKPGLVIPLAYLFMAGLYFFGLLITLLHRDMPAVIMVAMLFAAPFLFTDRPIRMILLTLTVVGCLCFMSFLYKDTDVARLDMWNSLAVGLVTIPIEILQMRHKFYSFDQSREINYLSETDVLTGAKNRNLYESSLKDYPQRCRDNLVAVFVDVNGLHELNDTKGHEAGDEMLKSVAQELLNAFGVRHVYRIGGDEFVAMRMDANEEDIRRDMDRISQVLSRQGYEISVGVVSRGKNELDMLALVREAEQGMYQAKSAYYQRAGKDRRRR